MAKLSRLVFGLVGICIVFLAAYFIMRPQTATQNDTSNLLFGRSVYKQNNVVGETAYPGYQITFPKDHGSHDHFDIEWWYLTANLQDDSGNPYGLQWTLFRFRNPSPTGTQIQDWHNSQIFMAHASIHSLDKHWFAEKFARGGVGNAAVTTLPFSLFIDDWQWLNLESSTNLFPATLEFTALDQSNLNKTPLKASFTIKQKGPFVLHGEEGFSVKSTSKHASHYYSAPFINIEGSITTSRGSNVGDSIALSGQAWFDHEWTSQLLDDSTEGWDWLSLHLEDGSKIMAFRMRLKDQSDFITGSFINKAGEQITLEPEDLLLQSTSTNKLDNKYLPLNWSLIIPSQKINISISTIKDEQWNNALIPYYEGMVTIKGTHKGNGFLELTGY